MHDDNYDRFHVLGTFDEAPGTLQSSGVRADAQCCKITWLEELASESNIIQACEDITQPGKTAGQDSRKLNVVLGWLIVHIYGSTSSFGLASFVVQENISLLPWIAAGPS